MLDSPPTTSVGRTLMFTSTGLEDLPRPLASEGDRRTPLVVVLLGASWAGAAGSAPAEGATAWGHMPGHSHSSRSGLTPSASRTPPAASWAVTAGSVASAMLRLIDNGNLHQTGYYKEMLVDNAVDKQGDPPCLVHLMLRAIEVRRGCRCTMQLVWCVVSSFIAAVYLDIAFGMCDASRG